MWVSMSAHHHTLNLSWYKSQELSDHIVSLIWGLGPHGLIRNQIRLDHKLVFIPCEYVNSMWERIKIHKQVLSGILEWNDTWKMGLVFHKNTAILSIHISNLQSSCHCHVRITNGERAPSQTFAFAFIWLKSQSLCLLSDASTGLYSWLYCTPVHSSLPLGSYKLPVVLFQCIPWKACDAK